MAGLRFFVPKFAQFSQMEYEELLTKTITTMKKQILLFMMALLPKAASAERVWIENVYYNLMSKGNIYWAEILPHPYNNYSGEFTISASVEHEGITYCVTTITQNAFRSCNGLTSIYIPNSITSIGKEAFSYCNGLVSIVVENGNPKYDSRNNCNGIIEISTNTLIAGCNTTIIPDDISTIADYAFSGCSGLSSVDIPNSVNSIGDGAFSGCSGLTSVDIPNSITSIGNNVFYGCVGLTTVTIPNNLTSIGDYAFSRCSGLTTIIIGNNVANIGNKAFEGCSNLKKVVVKNIAAWCKIRFTDPYSNPLSYAQHLYSDENTEIRDLLIPNNVTVIEKRAFCGCSNLISVTIGENIKTIKEWAFSGCEELTNVYCYAKNVPNTDTNVFNNSHVEHITLHVPSASINLYKVTEPWKNFKNIVALDGTTPETQKCSKPTIGYSKGKLTFKSETEGAEFVSEITDSDIKKYYDSEVQLSVTYNISVYATKSGYENSETVTATLCWIDVDPEKEGITDGTTSAKEIEASPVLIQSENGRISVSGAGDGTVISVFGTNGVKAGSAVSHIGQAVVDTKLPSGSVAIVKIGEKSVKVVVK